jgi:TatD DNase family protein
VIDTHAHLDGCDEPAAFLVERARAVGVSRIITIGTGIPSCHAALAIAAAEEGVYAAVGIDPHQRAARREPAPMSSSSLLGIRGRRGRGDGSRLLPRSRTTSRPA